MINFSKIISKDFYFEKTEIVARELIGKLFVKKSANGFLAAEIIETEAYIADFDEANHANRGMTNRNQAMFSEGGVIYVYKIYGVHHCVNIVTELDGVGCAVLIRAAMPVSGLEEMIVNRGVSDENRLLKGPGCFAKGFDLDIKDNFKSILDDDIFLCEHKKYSDEEIAVTPRIGISKSADLPLRFFKKGCKFVSSKKFGN